MVSRFFLIYGKLHKVAFVLNLCWTRGKIAHNPPFLATHFCNFFYIFIISTFYTNALIGKGFFCPFKKAQSKKCIFLSTLSFLLLCWISCWITNSSPLFSRTGTLVVPVPPHRSEQCVQITPIEIPLEVLPSTINSFSWCLYGLNGSH